MDVKKPALGGLWVGQLVPLFRVVAFEVIQQIAAKVRRYLQALAFHFLSGFWPVAVLVAAPHGGGQKIGNCDCGPCVVCSRMTTVANG